MIIIFWPKRFSTKSLKKKAMAGFKSDSSTDEGTMRTDKSEKTVHVAEIEQSSKDCWSPVSPTSTTVDETEIGKPSSPREDQDTAVESPQQPTTPQMQEP
ncbi:hypothetical protein AKO1_001348 [Acrasis kona]|uniref:Uncharacterized protein n=1 Tax=Acrasis kona TaxID=1008807 RepID=A0AAW2ZAZ1_9EUKA